jgi:uncharacterized protein
VGSRKAELNPDKLGVTFDGAVTVFFDPLAVTFPDPEHSFEEPRLITVGYSTDQRLLLVSHTDRSDVIRIISARHATPRERKRHENQENPEDELRPETTLTTQKACEESITDDFSKRAATSWFWSPTWRKHSDIRPPSTKRCDRWSNSLSRRAA